MKKILLVDDDPELRQLLATYLGRHGFDTLLLPDTSQLDAFLDRYQPQLIVLDLMMPGAALAHSGHDIAPTPQGLHHAMGDAGHLGVILGAASVALIVLTVVVAIRHRRRTKTRTRA